MEIGTDFRVQVHAFLYNFFLCYFTAVESRLYYLHKL